MHRNSNRPSLVGYGAGYGLTDPPGGIRAKLKSFNVVKFFDGLNQSQITFLNQVKEQHSPSNIAFGNTYHESQISFSKSTLGFLVTGLHSFCQLYFFLGREQWHSSNFFQIHADWIINTHTCLLYTSDAAD